MKQIDSKDLFILYEQYTHYGVVILKENFPPNNKAIWVHYEDKEAVFFLENDVVVKGFIGQK